MTNLTRISDELSARISGDETFRRQLIETATPEWLADAINSLPSDTPVPKGTQGYNRYLTQKDHWLGWLNPSAGTGTYPRSTGDGATAQKVYNRIAEPKMLLWLASAAGVSADLVTQARAVAEAESRFMSKCSAVRKVLPWRLVAERLVIHFSQRATPSGESSLVTTAEVTPESIGALLLQTAKRWNIPADLAKEIIQRDSVCIYCRQPFVGPNGVASRRASWEHIVNDAALITSSNIGLCCVACNASKGVMPLGKWLASDYCRRRSISKLTISSAAAQAVDRD